MKTREQLSSLRTNDADFHRYALSCVEFLCPEQQINRDYMIDVIMRRADAAEMTVRHDVQEKVFAWLAE